MVYEDPMAVLTVENPRPNYINIYGDFVAF